MREARHSRLYCGVRTTTMIAAVFAAVAVLLAGRSEGRNERTHISSFGIIDPTKRRRCVKPPYSSSFLPLVLVQWKVLPPVNRWMRPSSSSFLAYPGGSRSRRNMEAQKSRQAASMRAGEYCSRTTERPTATEVIAAPIFLSTSAISTLEPVAGAAAAGWLLILGLEGRRRRIGSNKDLPFLHVLLSLGRPLELHIRHSFMSSIPLPPPPRGLPDMMSASEGERVMEKGR